MRRVWLSLPFAAQRASPPRNRFSWTYVAIAVMWRILQQHGQNRFPQPSPSHNLRQFSGMGEWCRYVPVLVPTAAR